ncbi:MAG: uracil-DNA glycosylase [Verrucomicrobiota bacterium]
MLKHYLEQRLLSGQTHVGVRPGTLERMQGGRKPAAVSAGPGAAARAPQGRASMVAEEAPSARPAQPLMTTRTFLEASAPAASAAIRTMGGGAGAAGRAPVGAKLAAAAVARIEVTGETKAEKLAALAAIAETAPEARALGTLRDTMVFAVGNPEAQILLIGEAPGYEEEKQREPFVGPAGQKLTGILKAMGLERGDVYISNICKFRPATDGPNQGTANRAPNEAEMATCLPYVLTEISIIQPKVIVALGGVACKGLGIGEGVMRLRGRFYDVQGIPTMVTYHPSYILREEKLAGGGIRAKRECWEDMLKVMEKVGLPINDKQRGYFQK